MDKADIFKKINECINEVVPCAEISQDERLKEDIGLDSLSLVSVIVGLEEKFEIVFDDGDLDPAQLETVDNLVELVLKYV